MTITGERRRNWAPYNACGTCGAESSRPCRALDDGAGFCATPHPGRPHLPGITHHGRAPSAAHGRSTPPRWLNPPPTLPYGVECVRLALRGLTSTEVAEALHLSHGAVQNRLQRLYGWIGARNMTHAVAILAAQGLLTEEDFDSGAAVRLDRLATNSIEKEQSNG